MTTLTPAEQLAVDWTRARKAIREYLTKHPNAALLDAPVSIRTEYRHLRNLMISAKTKYENELDAEAAPCPLST